MPLPVEEKKVKIALVVDPLPLGFSVQMNFLKSVVSSLKERYEISVYSNYFAPSKKNELIELGLKVYQKEGKFVARLLKRTLFKYMNESVLWSVNWFFDGLEIFKGRNSDDPVLDDCKYVIDLSSTVMPRSDIWWIQGPPFYEVLEAMTSSNKLIKILFGMFRNKVKKVSMKIVIEKSRRSTKLVAVSRYIASFYKSIGINVDSIVHSSQNFELFKPSPGTIFNKYVLTYVGKETDFDLLISMAKYGINIIGFGSKIPPGMGFKSLVKHIKFVGSVGSEKLISLYSGAKFFAFPFTNEPFGWTPIESMLCGVPVLTYNKQGPSETVINGRTGWLVDTKEEFISKAYEIWNSPDTGMNREECIERGENLKLKYQLDKLLGILVSVST